MTFDNIIGHIPGWMSTLGMEPGIVISSRARLARNIAGNSYPHRATDDALDAIVERVLDAVPRTGIETDNYFPNDDLDDVQKAVFVERHLISPHHAAKGGARGVIIGGDERRSIMLNEEDHLRIQVLRPGFDTAGVLDDVNELERALQPGLDFAFSDRYGFLTACPTNLGTGLRISVLIHLPALVLTDEMQKVINSSSQLGLAVRGYYGEGSEVAGNLFQISNQTSLGKSGPEIARDLHKVVSTIVEYEKHAAETLLKDARSQVDDKVWRSVGILRTAHLMSTQEFMNLSSAVRLGLHMGILSRPRLTVLNELVIRTQPGHLQLLNKRELTPIERDIVRAGMVRERFVDE